MRRRDIPKVLFAAAASGSSPPSERYPSPPTAQTEAEARASLAPSRTEYQEGDVRRYGARTTASDNSDAFNRALLVSAHGGNAAFIPPGTWTITKPLYATLNSSMCGIGNASIIAAQDCDGMVFGNGGNYAVTGVSRFFRDFQLIGVRAPDSTHKGIVINFSASSTARVNAAQFENLFISNFGTGAYIRGLWFSNFVGCLFYNCYYGAYFIGQNCVNSIVNCTFNRGDIRSNGDSWGISFQTIDKESTQSTRIISSLVYSYDININALLAFELQIEHCDLSAAQSIGVKIIGTIGGCWLRDCWIETNKAAVTIGVQVLNIQPTIHTSVHITGNHINCDVPYPGSQGVVVGNSNAGIVVNENALIGFDLGITLGASAHLVCKFNRVSCVTSVYSATSHALLLNSLATDNEIGPNEVIAGETQVAKMQSGDARISVSDAASFPVGTPIQFDSSANGFTGGVTYLVTSSTPNGITVGAVESGPPIAPTGAASMAVFAAPLPLIYTAHTPRGLSFYGRGSFVMSFSGFAKDLSGAVDWISNGKFIALVAAGATTLVGPSNGHEMVAGGIPRFLWPAAVQQFAANLQDSGAAVQGVAQLSPSGVLTFFKSPNLDGFSASGIKGISNMALTYLYL